MVHVAELAAFLGACRDNDSHESVDMATLLQVVAALGAALLLIAFLLYWRRILRDAKDKEAWISLVLHEVRNPLNGLSSSLEFVQLAMLDLSRDVAAKGARTN